MNMIELNHELNRLVEGKPFKRSPPTISAWAPDGKGTVRLAVPVDPARLVDKDDEDVGD